MSQKVMIVVEVDDAFDKQFATEMILAGIKNQVFTCRAKVIEENTPVLQGIFPADNWQEQLFESDVAVFIKNGDVIKAIKHARQVKHWDLRTAKDYVDNLREKYKK